MPIGPDEIVALVDKIAALINQGIHSVLIKLSSPRIWLFSWPEIPTRNILSCDQKFRNLLSFESFQASSNAGGNGQKRRHWNRLCQHLHFLSHKVCAQSQWWFSDQFYVSASLLIFVGLTRVECMVNLSESMERKGGPTSNHPKVTSGSCLNVAKYLCG